MSGAIEIPPLHNTMGALFIGVLTAMGLWGVGCIQVYYYFTAYPNDALHLKFLVFIVWVLDTMHQGMITHTIYTYLVTEYANPVALGTIVSSLIWEVLVSGIICFLVQCFLVYRVWCLSRKSIITVGILLTFVLAELLLSVIYVVRALPLHTYVDLTSLANLSRAVNIFAVVSDVLIAATLIFLLQRSRTGFRQSETIINRCILFTINTGAMTSLFAVMSLVTITVLPATFVYICFYVNMSRLYTNTLVATLNARRTIRGANGNTVLDESTSGGTGSHSTNNLNLSLAKMGAGNKGMPTRVSISRSRGEIQGPMVVKVDREVHRDVSQDALPPSKQFNGNHSDSDVSGTYDDGKQDPEARV